MILITVSPSNTVLTSKLRKELDECIRSQRIIVCHWNCAKTICRLRGCLLILWNPLIHLLSEHVFNEKSFSFIINASCALSPCVASAESEETSNFNGRYVCCLEWKMNLNLASENRCSSTVCRLSIVYAQANRKRRTILAIIMAYGSIFFIHRIHSILDERTNGRHPIELSLSAHMRTGHCQRRKAIDFLFSRWIAWVRASGRASKRARVHKADTQESNEKYKSLAAISLPKNEKS